MIEYLVGTLAKKNADSIIVEVNGIGYRLGMSVKSIAKLPPSGAKVKILTDLEVHDDSIALYGFASQQEKDLFLRLNTVSGIGPKVALAALSTLSVDELSDAIVQGDVKAVSQVPGIGKKTAQRIILELKGSLETTLSSTASTSSGTVKSVVDALLGMGFTPDEAELSVKGLDAANMTESALLKSALKRLGAKE